MLCFECKPMIVNKNVMLWMQTYDCTQKCYALKANLWLYAKMLCFESKPFLLQVIRE